MQRGELFVADLPDAQAAGYLTLSAYAFFNRPLVTFVCVNPEHRRKGVGLQLLLGVEPHVGWERLYISTEEDNTAMHALLAKAEYQKCGEISQLNLDGRDEWVYFKDLSTTVA